MLSAKVETLIAVSETLNFTRAAEQLNLTQPAVSHHIKQLEEELGVKIFIRDGNGLKLTPEGEVVLKYARRMNALYTNLQTALADEKRNINRLTVGITHTAESNPIAEVLATYSSKHDGVRIKMVTNTINNLYYMLKTYDIDLAIAEGKFNDPDFNSILIDTDCLYLAVSTESALAHKSMVTLNDLKKEKMILRLPNSGTRNLFVSHLESNGMAIDDFNVILEVDNIATIKDLIRREFGVSILPKSACLDELKKGKISLLPVENLSMTREINLVYHKDFGHAQILHDIIKTYNETVKLYT